MMERAYQIVLKAPEVDRSPRCRRGSSRLPWICQGKTAAEAKREARFKVNWWLWVVRDLDPRAARYEEIRIAWTAYHDRPLGPQARRLDRYWQAWVIQEGWVDF
jgi:hypothetical protein